MRFHYEILVAIICTVYGLIFNNESLLFTKYVCSHIFTMQDNFDDLWMNHCVFLWAYLTNSGLAFDGRALGQLPRYITSTQLIQAFPEWTGCAVVFCAQLLKCARCEAGISGKHVSWSPPWQITLMVIRLSVCINSNCPEFCTSQFSQLVCMWRFKIVSYPASKCQGAECKMSWLK